MPTIAELLGEVSYAKLNENKRLLATIAQREAEIIAVIGEAKFKGVRMEIRARIWDGLPNSMDIYDRRKLQDELWLQFITDCDVNKAAKSLVVPYGFGNPVTSRRQSKHKRTLSNPKYKPQDSLQLVLTQRASVIYRETRVVHERSTEDFEL